jgi:hypothetical protein
MSVLKAFNGHLIEFVTEIKKVFPDDADARTGSIFLEGLVKVNPKSVIKGWNDCMNDSYKEQILKGNVDYFINKNYDQDVEGSNDKTRVLTMINSFRVKVRNMGEENQQKSMKYIQNLTKLCNMYFQNISV